ncbi:LysR family transcriptional regulator NmoR, partial [Pseudomonas aeruginosa]
RLGSMESTAASRLPALLASYHKACPRVALEVSTGTSRALFDGVRARRLDCALVAAGPGWADELDGSGLRGEPLFREDLLMILPAEHPPVHDVAEVRLRTLAGFARGCTYRQLAEDSLGAPLTVQEVGSYHAILACVAAGACVGVLPRSVLQLLGTPPLRSLPFAEVDTWLVWREGYATAAFERWRGVLGQAGD